MAGNLAFVQRRLGDLTGALATQNRALAVSEAGLGTDHPDLVLLLINLIATHQSLGHLREADRVGERALSIGMARLPEGHADRVILLRAHSVTALTSRVRGVLQKAKVERLLGRVQEARSLYEKVLADPDMKDSPGHRADARLGLAFCEWLLGDEGAAREFEAAVSEFSGSDAADTGELLVASAGFASVRGEIDLALGRLEEALRAGYRSAAILSEPDLAAVREDTRFDGIAAQLESLLQPSP